VKTPKHFVSAHFQSMMDPNPVKRPSAKESFTPPPAKK
jgi:hypothetical protein